MDKKKLLLSKWTAVKPQAREKHFMVSRVLEDEQGDILTCVLEAVITTQEYHISPSELENTDVWLKGWH